MAKKYLDYDGLLYFWGKLKAAFATKGQAISNITRSGTTFTATRADNTTFTFDQQDNTVAKTTTTPKANGTAAIGSETKYAAGDHVHPLQTTVSGNAGTATTLKTARNIDGISFDGSSNIHHFALCSTEAATAAKVATVEDSMTFTLAEGAIVFVKFEYENDVDSPTLNVNGTGAKNIYRYGSTAPSTTAATSWRAGSVVGLVYDGSAWQMMNWLNDNTTYTNASLGQGYASCTTAASTVAKTASLSSYTLVTGGIVSVKFSNDVPASATLNVNSKGAKAIYYKGAAIQDGVIKAGNVATFIYSSQYHLIAIDNRASDTTPKANGTASAGTEEQYSRGDHVHPLQTTVSGNAGTATTLKTARNIDGISFNGSANIHHFATSSTGANFQSKVATVEDSMTFTLAKGAIVFVKFDHENTAAQSVNNNNVTTYLTLNVNDTGAKTIYRYGTTTIGNSDSLSWKAGSVVPFMYDGTSWLIIGWLNDNTEYVPESLGHAYGTCSTVFSALSLEGAVNIVNNQLGTNQSPPYVPSAGGMITVKFTYSLCAGAKLNVENTVALPVYYKGSAINSNTIVNAGDIVTFISTNTVGSIGGHYEIVSIASQASNATPQAPGTANAGTAERWSRSDHVHPLQTTISGNAGSADALSTPRTIDGVLFDGTSNIIHYSTCTSSASQAAKEAIHGQDYDNISAGAIVYVKFDNGNTASNPTLILPGMDSAKSIYMYGSTVPTWAANSVVPFVYDGTNFVIIGTSNSSGYGTCTTAKATNVKTATVPNFGLRAGSIVAIKFSYVLQAGNTLNINSTGAKSIYYRGNPLTNNVIDSEGTTVTFLYDGTNYHIISNDLPAPGTATTSTAGLMSAADKTKLNKLSFDSNNKIDSSCLPSYVDDVIEAYEVSGSSTLSAGWLSETAGGTALTPQTGVIYILMADTTEYAANTQFRWSGTTYVKLNDGGVSAITNTEIDTICAT